MARDMFKDETLSKAAKLRFKKRKECIMKKSRELSVLCDIKVCALVSDPDDGAIETWPENRLEFQEILKDHVVKMEKNGKVVKENNKNTCIVGDESFLKMIDEKLEYVNRRIEWLTKLNNDQNQSFFVQNLHENSAIPSSQSVNCYTWAGSSAPSFVQPLQSGFSRELEVVKWSGSQFSHPLQCVEPQLLSEFEEFPNLQLQPQEFQMEDIIWVQQNTTDDEEWRFLQGLDLDSMLQAMDGL
ncbi:hypothetical protein LIER_42573 [Lithospermum erythrorhizon]|uniref:MADS-box domain-containing protein n=1 Tax=Lithospermum erythrorhizon TaxID=34254 RepID=A0AAV3NJR4_LITER